MAKGNQSTRKQTIREKLTYGTPRARASPTWLRDRRLQFEASTQSTCDP